ncbi:hypothetical protein SLS60_006787 [Paraconiothyrium brasiliense]|uniref:Uncharacterized protein n=1 Tax=Paraconiothyrium brasiliense TaxID=300254 RepID=A0ABR3R8V7_9PLEO
MEYTDTRSSHRALPAPQEDIKDYSADGSATSSRRLIVGWQTITLLFGNYAIDTMTYTYANAKLIHIAHVVLVAGAVPETASPCFADCSYETSIVSNVGNPAYYTGGWLSRREDELHRMNFDTFTMNITRILGVIDSMYPDILQLEEHHILRCEPALATYQVHFAYVNGSRSFTYDLVAGEKLADTFVEGVYPDPLASSDKLWNTTTVRNLQKLNLYGLLDTIVTTLAGSHDQMRFLGANLGTFPYTLSNGTTVDFDHPDVRFTYVGSSVEPNKTLIGDTVFNQDRNNMTSDGPSLVITEKLLNEVVANVTIATMLGLYPLSIWNTTVNATMTTYRNTYSFSQPLLLTLPYSLSLAMSLPFLIIGFLSLRSNGVAALNDSFLQLLVNITRSNGLDRITRPCALGDNEMATTELNNTRIMYGRLSTDEAADGTTHRMGFGLEVEILAASDRQDDAKYKIDR